VGCAPTGHPQSVGGTALTETAVGIIGTNSDNGGVLTMNEPQVWTLIGAFIAGPATLVALVLRVVSTEINSLRNEMSVRFDHLDRDVQALTRHVFGDH
jgi:hypothetical protein